MDLTADNNRERETASFCHPSVRKQHFSVRVIKAEADKKVTLPQCLMNPLKCIIQIPLFIEGSKVTFNIIKSSSRNYMFADLIISSYKIR